MNRPGRNRLGLFFSSLVLLTFIGVTPQLANAACCNYVRYEDCDPCCYTYLWYLCCTGQAELISITFDGECQARLHKNPPDANRRAPVLAVRG